MKSSTCSCVAHEIKVMSDLGALVCVMKAAGCSVFVNKPCMLLDVCLSWETWKGNAISCQVSFVWLC